MKVLIAEIAICLLLASLLGLLIGWLCKGAFARDKLNLKEREWTEKYNGLEQRHKSELSATRKDSDVMSKQVEALDSKNKALAASLDANKLAVQKAHIETQRLDNKQKETHNRLQQVLAEKEREISRLQKENARGKDVPPRAYGFSSNKPAEVRPRQSGQRDTHTDKPAGSQSDVRRQTSRDSNVAGGRPSIGNKKTPQQQSFKPGTQRQQGNISSMERSGPGPNSAPQRTQTNVPDNRPPSAAPAGSGAAGDSMQDTVAMESTNHDIDATNAIGSSNTKPGTTTNETDTKPRKRSLWERVRGKGKDNS